MPFVGAVPSDQWQESLALANGEAEPGERLPPGPLRDERTARPHKTIRGMRKGVSTGEEEIADVGREMFRPLLGDEVDEIWPEAGGGPEQP